ncbi:hypothetical protein [Vibrio sp. CK2-1]|uniref:hypothetical protein n=1 Tax=Vibrio sp. CK2-1 TaxID=2912249 RepID=UPI001F3D25CE|nr:hypothetical protein [Vibrio sp. CK2-1]MCF7355294.1 hypothetical protein [Vibrio sp. CK2-1]
MSLFEKLKTLVASMQGQQDFSYLKDLDQAQLQSLTTDGQSKAEKYAAQQELLKRALNKQ